MDVNGTRAPRYQFLLHDRVNLLYDQAPVGQITNLVISLLVVLLLWADVPKEILSTWYGAILLVVGIRYVLYSLYRKSADKVTDTAWRNLYLGGTVMAGLTWGLGGIYLFPPDSVIHQLLLTTIIGGMAAGSTSVLIADRWVLTSFLLTSVVPYSVFLLGETGGHYVYLGLGGMFYAMVLLYTSNNTYKSMMQSVALRLHNNELLQQMTESHASLKQNNERLMDEILERKHAQSELRRLADKLDQRVEERTAELVRVNESLSEQIKRREAIESILQDQKDQIELVLYSIAEGIIETDAEGRIQYLNQSAEKFLRCRAKEAKLRLWQEFVSVVDETSGRVLEDRIRESVESARSVEYPANAILLNRCNQSMAVAIMVSPKIDLQGIVRGTVIVIRDVGEARELRKKLSYYATHDSLTGLMNRREFENQLVKVINNSRQKAGQQSLLYVDLDQFKIVNDSCGHSAGDELLKQLTTILREKMRDTDALARLGGDEFGILLRRCPLRRAVKIARTIVDLVKNFSFVWQSSVFELGVSIGVVEINARSVDLNQVLSAADIACYRAKERGRGRFHVYIEQDQMHRGRQRQLGWVSRLKHAMDENRFVLYSQPIVPVMLQQQPNHFEILLRMVDEEGKTVLPGSFLVAAERYHVMDVIDRWVMAKIIEDYPSVCKSIGVPGALLSINISGESLGNRSIQSYLIDALKQVHYADRICIEIAEVSAISNLVETLQFCRKLKSAGCQIALDDFGSCMSSFSYLKQLPVDFLKITGAFIRTMAKDDVDRATVDSIIRLGRVMHIKTIAENVENTATVSQLKTIDVDFIQGYAVARPKPVNLQSAPQLH